MVGELIGAYKVPLAWVIALVIMLMATHEWADMHYMPVSDAMAADESIERKLDANYRDLAGKIEVNSSLLKTHIQGYLINENRKAIELIKDQQFDLDQFIAVNGETQMTRERRNELERKLEILTEQRECLINHGERCD